MTRNRKEKPSLRILATVVLLLSPSTSVTWAETLRLDSGRTLEVDSATVEGTSLRVRLFDMDEDDEISIPKSSLSAEERRRYFGDVPEPPAPAPPVPKSPETTPQPKPPTARTATASPRQNAPRTAFPKTTSTPKTATSGTRPLTRLPVRRSKPTSIKNIDSKLSKADATRLTSPATFVVRVSDLKTGVFEPRPGKRMPYRYFAPVNLREKQKVPLVLFLHGAGETGTDNSLQLSKHMGPLALVQPWVQEKTPCYLVAPQIWRGGLWCGSFAGPSEGLSMAVSIVDEFVEKYPNVDPERLYVTGLSSGGIGAWDALAKYPGKFAAAVPISAGWDPDMLGTQQGLAVWAFYNKGDSDFVQTTCDGMLKRVLAQGGVPQRTIYSKHGHDAWSAAYSEPELIPWLFEQRRFRAIDVRPQAKRANLQDMQRELKKKQSTHR